MSESLEVVRHYKLQSNHLIAQASPRRDGAYVLLARDGESDEPPQPGKEKKEERFQEAVKEFLQTSLGKTYRVSSGETLAYKFVISPDGSVRPRDPKEPEQGFGYETDILIRKEGQVVPLLVIELKFGAFTTHDVITYSSKAEQHKRIYPYLRYGFVVGGSKKPLAMRFLNHNQAFDFGMSVLNIEDGGEKLLELVKRQLKYAELLVERLRLSRTSFTRYETSLEIE